ncbi:hypothetical protein M422DRAFT_43956 [Sphaerobolus stellatus SS14]|nr:hypothetical protein M422DRAFT_43956 [Sphaerobolus stellatus SS14]
MARRHELPLSLLILTLAMSTSCITTTRSNFTMQTRTISPYDPFRSIRLHEPPKPSEPVCCLVPPTSDGFSPTAEFLSFEEWKSKQFALQTQTQNLTSSDSSRTDNESGSPHIPSPTVEGESDTTLPAVVEPSRPRLRVPLTDRFNYASLDCSARVHASHREARSPSAILSSKKDRYMLSPCSAQPNFVIVELCEDIRIDTVQLANFEFFSGVFRDFKVSVAQTTAEGQAWVEMGAYRAKNIRGVQSFHPMVELRPFYRYIRIDFLSHYGNEFYCPISLLRVYGLTQLEEWKWETWQILPEENSVAPPQQIPDSIMKEEQGITIILPNSTTLAAVSETSQSVVLSQAASEGASSIAETTAKTKRSEAAIMPYPNTQVITSSQISTIEASPLTTIHQSSTPLPQPAIIPPNDTHTPIASSVSQDNSVSTATPTNASIISGSASSTITLPTSTAVSSSTVPTVVTIPPPSQPPITGGESIYRTIMNRLSRLESNTTLYQKYVQEQTMGIHEGLRRMEEDIGRLDGVSKAQLMMFNKAMQELDRRRRQMEEERLELLEIVNSLTEEVILEKRLGIAQLCLLLTVLIFMALTRGSRADAASFFDGTMHRLSGFRGGRRSWSSYDWTHGDYGSQPHTPVPFVQNKKTKHEATMTAQDEEEVIPPSTPKSPRPIPSSPRSRNVTPRPKSIERPSLRLRRSNSHTASAPVSVTKRLARTAHLHELQRSVRRRPRSGHWDVSSEEDKEDGSPKLNRRTMKTQPIEQEELSSRPDTTEGESWVDTEPGSEHGFDGSESEGLVDRLPDGL